MNKPVRKYVAVVAALSAVVVLAVSGWALAEKPIKIIQGNFEVVFNGGFKPKTLPKKKQAPITFNVSGEMRTLDGTHVPALKEFVIEGDKHASIDVKGIPRCSSRQLQSIDTARARKVCGPALIGSGKTKAGIKFPEQPEIFANSELLVFNGGTQGGVTTLFVHAYITVPTPAAIVTTVKIKKIHKGRYGLLSVASIPKIAGGSGSVISFNLTLKKGILSASCPDGHLNAHGTAGFVDGTKISGTVIRTCTGKG